MQPYQWIIGLMFAAITFLIGLIVGRLNVSKVVEPLRDTVTVHNGKIDHLEEKCADNTRHFDKVIELMTKIVDQNNIFILKMMVGG